jgi:hypothetical protein
MSVNVVVHKGKRVLYGDFRGLRRNEQQIACLEELAAALEDAPVAELVVTNFEGSSLGPDFMKRVKELGKQHQAKMSRQAVLGISGLNEILFRGYLSFTGQKNIQPFESEAAAMDWLVS